jgi:hypothetical protein
MTFLGVAAALLAPAARADEVQVEWAPPPVSFLLPATSGAGPKGVVDAALEASAVEPIGDGRLLLVADDKTNDSVVVEAATALRVGQPLGCRTFPGENAKWEAMACDEEGAYYLIGSHSGRPGELAAHSYLFRFRLKGGGADGTPLAIDESSVVRWDVAGALAKEGLYSRADPAKHRVKIEGLAVRTRRDPAGRIAGRELVVGLREPDDPITAYAADITRTPPPDAPLALRRLFTFAGGAREKVRAQLSSLEYVPAWSGFLVTTSSEDAENAYHGNTLWFLPDDALSPTRPARAQKVWLFGVGVKVEGLCLLPAPAAAPAGYGAARLAVVYDNDAARTKKESLLQFLTLVRWPE